MNMLQWTKKLLLVGGMGATLLFVTGCGNSIKDGPAAAGDTVYITYSAVFDKHPRILFDTTDKNIVRMMKSSLAKENYGPEKIVLGENEGFCSTLQDHIIGMSAGESKKITITPQDCNRPKYDVNNTKTEPGLVYSKANIGIKEGKIMYKEGKNVMVKKITGANKKQKIIRDMNPLETYENINYNITLVQVGGDSVKGREENKE